MGIARVTDLTSRIVRASTTEVLAPVKITDLQDRSAFARADIPFRVRFTNIEIPGYGPSTAAPIGVAVIGVNNYIL